MSEDGLTMPSNGSQADTAVGVQLQSLRVFQCLSRDQAAGMLHISVNTLDQIESGTIRPLAPLLLMFADVYKVPPSHIFFIAKNAAGSDPPDIA